MSGAVRLEVFGKAMLVERSGGGWAVYYPGGDGKRRPAWDIVIPPFVTDPELETYLADLCHEWATDKHPDVRRLD